MKPTTMRKTVPVIFVCALALVGCLDRPSCPQCNDTSTAFLSTLAQGQTKPAFDQLFEHSLLSKKSLKSQQFVRLTNGLLRQYGAIYSYEKIATQQNGRIVTISYLLYQKKGASRWTFYFYRAPETDQWRLKDLNASDQSRFLTKDPQ